MVSNSQSDVIIRAFFPITQAAMTRQKAYLILTALFTLMFIVLILLGAYLLSIHSKQFAVAAFLAQIGSLALYIRHKARAQMARMQQTENH